MFLKNLSKNVFFLI
jgi:hypothetical protein